MKIHRLFFSFYRFSWRIYGKVLIFIISHSFCWGKSGKLTEHPPKCCASLRQTRERTTAERTTGTSKEFAFGRKGLPGCIAVEEIHPAGVLATPYTRRPRSARSTSSPTPPDHMSTKYVLNTKPTHAEMRTFQTIVIIS